MLVLLLPLLAVAVYQKNGHTLNKVNYTFIGTFLGKQWLPGHILWWWVMGNYTDCQNIYTLKVTVVNWGITQNTPSRGPGEDGSGLIYFAWRHLLETHLHSGERMMLVHKNEALLLCLAKWHPPTTPLGGLYFSVKRLILWLLNRNTLQYLKKLCSNECTLF